MPVLEHVKGANLVVALTVTSAVWVRGIVIRTAIVPRVSAAEKTIAPRKILSIGTTIRSDSTTAVNQTQEV